MTKLRIIEGPMKGQTFELDKDTVFVGRSSTNDIQIADTAISRKHIKIFRLENLFFVEDLRSTNRTFINNEPLEPGEGFQVSEEDTISIGETVIRLVETPEKKSLYIKDLPISFSEKETDENTHIPEERRSRSLRGLELIYRVSELTKERLNIGEFLEKVADLLLDSLPRIDKAAIFLFDNEKKQIKEEYSRPIQDRGLDADLYGRTAAEKVLQEGKALEMSTKTHKASPGFSENWDNLEMRSVMCVPIGRGSELCGAIYIEGLREEKAFRDEDLLLLKSISGPVALAIENARLASMLKK